MREIKKNIKLIKNWKNVIFQKLHFLNLKKKICFYHFIFFVFFCLKKMYTFCRFDIPLPLFHSDANKMMVSNYRRGSRNLEIEIKKRTQKSIYNSLQNLVRKAFKNTFCKLKMYPISGFWTKNGRLVHNETKKDMFCRSAWRQISARKACKNVVPDLIWIQKYAFWTPLSVLHVPFGSICRVWAKTPTKRSFNAQSESLCKGSD